MAIVDYYQDAEDNGQRTAVQGFNLPSPTAPTTTYSGVDRPTNIGSIFDYGNGTTATRVDGGWKYDWRDQPYQDLLSDKDIADQRALTQARASGQTFNGQHAAEDDLSLFQQMGRTSANAAISAAQSGQGGASRDAYNINYPGFQFNDPYTRQFEDVIRQQMSNLSQPQSNPALEKFLSFLNQRMDSLTQTPGYSPEDLALLRTQALDPIEQDRAASQKRATERAARAGFLPTSGITQLTSAPNGGTETLDQTYDRMRAAAQRDLAINAITKRNADLDKALGVGSIMGVQIPQAQRAEDQTRRSELLNLAQILYNLPRNAQQDALAVLSGSPNSNDLFNQAMQQQQNQRLQQQQDAQKWAAIGQLIAQMVF